MCSGLRGFFSENGEGVGGVLRWLDVWQSDHFYFRSTHHSRRSIDGLIVAAFAAEYHWLFSLGCMPHRQKLLLPEYGSI